jgi:uncharacterized glyoxalase superfamily protein PhnB
VANSTIVPAMRYKDAKAAVEWLCTVLGFVTHAAYEGPDGKIMHAELTLGGGMIMLGSAKDDEYGRQFRTPAELDGMETRGVYLVVADTDAVFARVTAAGAQVVRPLRNTEYGSREFTVKDPEGYSWSVGTYDPWKTHP